MQENQRTSKLLLCFSLLHATWCWNTGSEQAEGGSRCVASGQRAPGLQPICDIEKPGHSSMTVKEDVDG